MKRHLYRQLQLLFLVALTLPFLSSCKDKDEATIAPSKTDLLVAHQWRGDQVLMMGINITETGAIQTGIPDIRTIWLTFNKDKTYVAKTDQGVRFEGIWRFNEDETKIYFDFFGLSEFDLKELTDDNLNIGTRISKRQLSFLANVLNVDLGIINRFPDGTQFEIELIFVKP